MLRNPRKWARVCPSFFPNYSSVGQFYYLIFVQPETNKIIPIYDNREYVEREKMQEEIVKQLKKRKAV